MTAPIPLNNGVVIAHRVCAWVPGATEAFIVGSDREMTDAEWTEYCEKLLVITKTGGANHANL